jgi:uncharacterized membrane protein
MIVTSLHIALLLSILLCSLVAGLLFGFAVVVMPGIAKLTDREFLSSFKHMDGIIQDDQPLFILVWAGSILSLTSTLILGTLNLDGMELYLLWIASVLYLLGGSNTDISVQYSSQQFVAKHGCTGFRRI